MIDKCVDEVPLYTLSTKVIKHRSSNSGPCLYRDHNQRRNLNEKEVPDLLFGVDVIRFVELGVPESKEVKQVLECLFCQDKVEHIKTEK